jgi:CheY-like chemotaxis protein
MSTTPTNASSRSKAPNTHTAFASSNGSAGAATSAELATNPKSLLGTLGNTRADLALSLGKRVRHLSAMLRGLTELDGTAQKEAKATIRAQVLELNATAERLKIDPLARATVDILGQFDRGDDAGRIERSLSLLPTLVWGERAPAPRDEVASATVLFFGAGDWTVAFRKNNDGGERYACDATTDARRAKRIAREFNLSLIVLDADLPDAVELANELLDDSLTDNIPMMAVGTFENPSDIARLTALGVTRIHRKPITPEELRVEADAFRLQLAAGLQDPLGECSIEELAFRLAEDLRREIGQVPARLRTTSINFGEGAEILGPLMGAIGRIREAITARSGGNVQYASNHMHGYAWLMSNTHSDRTQSAERSSDRVSLENGLRPRGEQAALSSLKGLRVLVADDDPAITWFIADILRSAGCLVDEVVDGESALNRAFATPPDLVVCDVLMPKMDGLALCRTLRSDVWLADRPVLLLSWKEDLLHRIRELGVRAAGYIRKESDEQAILGQVREALRAHARIVDRVRDLPASGGIMGRLDGLLATTLLERAIALHRDCRIVLRDAQTLFEVEIREGIVVRALRTSGDGHVLAGQLALEKLLSVSSGRFWIEKNTTAVDSTGPGSLSPSAFAELQLEVSRRRSIARGLRLGHLTELASLAMNDERANDFASSSHPHVRNIVKQLLRGVAPRALMLQGTVEPAMLEDVLRRLAVCGAIDCVRDVEGNELSQPLSIPRFLGQEVDGQLRSALPPRVALRADDPKEHSARPIEVSEATDQLIRHTATSVDGTLYGGKDLSRMSHLRLDVKPSTMIHPLSASTDASAKDIDAAQALSRNPPKAIIKDLAGQAVATASGTASAKTLQEAAELSIPIVESQGLGADAHASESMIVTDDEASPRAASVTIRPTAKKSEKKKTKSMHIALVTAGFACGAALLVGGEGSSGAQALVARAKSFAAGVFLRPSESPAPSANVTVEYAPIAPNANFNVELLVQGEWDLKLDGADLPKEMLRANGTELRQMRTLAAGIHRVSIPAIHREWTFEVKPGASSRVRVAPATSSGAGKP